MCLLINSFTSDKDFPTLADEDYVVSLKKSIDEQERLRTVVSEYNATLAAALSSLGQYVVETDPTAVESFRKHIGRLTDMVRAAERTPDATLDPSVSPTLRGELRDYRDKAKRFLNGLHEKLIQTAEALNTLLQSVEDGGSSSEDQLKAEIGQLRTIVASDDLAYIRSRIEESIASITKYLDQLRREKDVVILQLKDEIRTLHASAESARRAAMLDPSTGFYRREHFENLIRRELAEGTEIGITHIWLRNLNSLVDSRPPRLLEQVLEALSERLQNIVPAGSVLSRWRRDVICVMLPIPLVRKVSQQATNSLGGRYVCMDDGIARTFYMQIVVTSTCSAPLEDADAFLQKLECLSAAESETGSSSQLG